MDALFHYRCVDYVLIERGNFGSTFLCGNDTFESSTTSKDIFLHIVIFLHRVPLALRE
jgi:hypothetical protein